MLQRWLPALSDVAAGLQTAVVQDQLALLRLRNTSPAFLGELQTVETETHLLDLTWRHDGYFVRLRADLRDHSFAVTHSDGSDDEQVLSYPG